MNHFKNAHEATNGIKIFKSDETEPETPIQTIRIKNKVNGMEFGIEKCAIVWRKKNEK